jgi:hypothetical protein
VSRHNLVVSQFEFQHRPWRTTWLRISPQQTKQRSESESDMSEITVFTSYSHDTALHTQRVLSDTPVDISRIDKYAPARVIGREAGKFLHG